MSDKEIKAILNKPYTELQCMDFIVEYNTQGYKIETLNNGTIQAFEMVKTDEEQAKEERERLNMLSLTAADVERAIYKAVGQDFDDIIKELSSYAAEQLGDLDLKALKIELKANNFYRGNPYIEQVGALLGFTPQMLDEFFETNDYTKLIKVEEDLNSGEKPIEGDIALVEPAEREEVEE